MAKAETTTATATSKNGEEKAKRKPNPFRRVLEDMVDERSIKVELGVDKPETEYSRVIRTDDGEIFGVKLQRLEKTKGE